MLTDCRLNSVETDTVCDFTQGVQEIANAACAAPHIVEILAVAPWLAEPQFVEAGPSAEHKFRPKQRMIGDFDDKSGQNEVLLNLFVRAPWHATTPVSEVG